MKICLTCQKGDWTVAHTGKGKFASRLIRVWEGLGVKVTQDPKERVDIDLQITRYMYTPKYARKSIIRRGPVKYDTNMDYKHHNKLERGNLKQCDAIVYQSLFSKNANHKLVYNPKGRVPETVIYNGADSADYVGVKPYQSEFKYNFLASTREWVLEKRLVDIIKSFKEADIHDSKLWIAGQIWDKPNRFPDFQKDFKKRFGCVNIQFLGPTDDRKLARLYRMATCLLHAVYIDAQPNAIAEALAAGCKVLCTNVGGQREVIGKVNPDWIVQDKPWDFKPCNRRKLPRLNRCEYAAAMLDMCNDATEIDASCIDINNIASQYLNFFEKVLSDA